MCMNALYLILLKIRACMCQNALLLYHLNESWCVSDWSLYDIIKMRARMSLNALYMILLK